MLSLQCLDRRIDDRDTLLTEIAAGETARNVQQLGALSHTGLPSRGGGPRRNHYVHGQVEATNGDVQRSGQR